MNAEIPPSNLISKKWVPQVRGPHGTGIPGERFLLAGVKRQVFADGVIKGWDTATLQCRPERASNANGQVAPWAGLAAIVRDPNR
jgi:hypothetical protein